MCNKTSGLSLPIHEWLRNGEEWERRILRQCAECTKYVIQPVTLLDDDYPFCMNCFSHKVRVSLANETVAFVCEKCGHTTRFLDAPTEVSTHGK
jgi:hypothetical protein